MDCLTCIDFKNFSILGSRQEATAVHLEAVDLFKPLSDMPILGSSNSAANKDTMSRTWTNKNTTI